MEEENKNIQIQVKKIPAFTVRKKGSILKNIFLLRKQSSVVESSQNQEPDEEILLVGRHPDCHITLEHPSISRYHLRIHSNPSSHSLSVVDLSSVHGTWVSGRKIEPGVHVALKEGDTVNIGGSSRVYELHWVPSSRAYDVDEQFVPAVHTIKEGTNQDEKGEERLLNDDLECLDLSSSDMVHDSPLKTLNSLVVSETTSVSDSENNSDDQLMMNCSKSSCDDAEVEQSSPWKADNGNGEPFTAVCVEAPLATSEAMSEKDVSDCQNNSEDKLNWLRDNDQSHGAIKDDLVSVDLFSGIETHEEDALNQNIAISNETDIVNENQQNINNDSDENRDVGCEFEKMNQTKMMDESVDHEKMKKESSFVLLPDVADMDEDKIFTPDMSKAKEIHMNLQSGHKLSDSVKLFDSVNGKEMEFYIPDKENKNSNACSGKSLSKKVVNPVVCEEKGIFGSSQNLFATDEGTHRELEVDPFLNREEVLAISSEKENKSTQFIMDGSCNSINYPRTVQENLPKKRWTMVVDTNSLLDQKSLKHLKLLEGIKGTQLFVPKIVVRELMEIKSQDNFFKRDSGKVSLALKWIDECMMNTRWWIHMDDDDDAAIVRDLMDIKRQDDFFKRNSKKVSLALKWIDECMMNTRWWIHMDDDETVHSSTAVPEVLEIALHLRKEIADQNIIILSNNLTLKIKAMGEGIMCEAAEEFHESLVNPFSERFMWVGSSARGLTWSCVDDDTVRQKYRRFGLDGSHYYKGLKLLARVTTSQLVS